MMCVPAFGNVRVLVKGVLPLMDEADPPSVVKSDGTLNVTGTPVTAALAVFSAVTVTVSVSPGSPVILVGEIASLLVGVGDT